MSGSSFFHNSKMTMGKISLAIAALLTIVAVNLPVANASSKIPHEKSKFVVSDFETYNTEIGRTSVKGVIPKISIQEVGVKNAKAASEVNQKVEDYITGLIQQFKHNTVNSYGSLTFSYDIVNNDKEWFSLKVASTEIHASGFERVKYFNIDKEKGKVVNLKDLFKPKVDYVTLISEDISHQMKKQIVLNRIERLKDKTKTVKIVDYYTGPNGFKTIDANQSFYINEYKELIIAFDEYSVAPGYMGCPEFSINPMAVSY